MMSLLCVRTYYTVNKIDQAGLKPTPYILYKLLPSCWKFLFNRYRTELATSSQSFFHVTILRARKKHSLVLKFRFISSVHNWSELKKQN